MLLATLLLLIKKHPRQILCCMLRADPFLNSKTKTIRRKMHKKSSFRPKLISILVDTLRTKIVIFGAQKTHTWSYRMLMNGLGLSDVSIPFQNYDLSTCNNAIIKEKDKLKECFMSTKFNNNN